MRAREQRPSSREIARTALSCFSGDRLLLFHALTAFAVAPPPPTQLPISAEGMFREMGEREREGEGAVQLFAE